MIDKEKVREICRLYWDAKEGTEDEIITEWLEQNQPEPAVVGLSDEQLYVFSKQVFSQEYQQQGLISCYRNWAKSQTFSQSEVTKLEKEIAEMQIAYIDLQGYSSEIKKELEQLKSQQFKPNWNDAPFGAVRGINSTRWWNEKGEYIETTNSVSFERPKPTPQVEVGQVWRSDVEEVRVIEFGRRNGEETVCFKDVNTDCIKQLATSYFLAKFERVSW